MIIFYLNDLSGETFWEEDPELLIVAREAPSSPGACWEAGFASSSQL